jgi:hypothetical protein
MLVTGGSCALPSFAVGVAIISFILWGKGSISITYKNLCWVKKMKAVCIPKKSNLALAQVKY